MPVPRTTSAHLPRWVPSPALLIGLVLAAILLGVTLAKGLVDADYFGHLTTGRLIAESGRIPSTDPFSFTWGGMPWTPHEWLGQLLIARLVDGAGEVAALAVFGLLAGAIVVIHAVGLQRLGVRTPVIALAAGLGALVLFPYLTVRPQLLSWVLMTVLVWLLLGLRPDRPWRLAMIPALFFLWANLHGLYVVGFGFIGVYALFTLAGRTPMASRRWLVLVALAGAVIASALTPAGPAGLLYPLRYVDTGDWGLAHIQEWQSPDFHNPAHWALLALVLALAANGGRAAPGWLVTLSYVTLAMALVSLRNAPVAAVVAIPVLAMGISDRWPTRRAPGPRAAAARRILETGLTAVVIAASLLILVPRDPGAASRAAVEARYPVAAVDLLVRTVPDARVLAEYGWGGYVISRLYDTGGGVFVDGRNDMYDQAVLEEYSMVRAADPGWEEILEHRGVEVILFPPDIAVVRGFAQDAGWCEAYRDEVQVLLLRGCP